MSYDNFFKAARGAKKNNVSKPVRQQDQNLRSEKFVPKIKKNMNNSVEEMLRDLAQKRREGRRKSIPIPWHSIVLLLMGLAIAVYGLLNPQTFEQLFASIEVRVLGQVQAKDTKDEAKKTQANNKEGEKNSESRVGNELEEKKSKTTWSSEELSHFNKLSERKMELDRREEELNELEAELHKQKKEVEVRIKKLEEIRTQISGVLKERVKVDAEKVKKLVEFYSNMKPQNAAKIISTINEDLAVEILGKMKKKNAADIFNLLTPEKAQVLSEKYAGYKRR